MNVKELEQKQEEPVQDIETGDILMIHQAIGGFLQAQDDDGDINTDNWKSGKVNVRIYISDDRISLPITETDSFGIVFNVCFSSLLQFIAYNSNRFIWNRISIHCLFQFIAYN